MSKKATPAECFCRCALVMPGEQRAIGRVTHGILTCDGYECPYCGGPVSGSGVEHLWCGDVHRAARDALGIGLGYDSPRSSGTGKRKGGSRG